MKKALCLISGGFDSPVAAYRTAASGYHVDYLFFYSLPFVRERDKELVEKCVQLLAKFAKTRASKLFIVNNEKILRNLQQHADKRLHIVMRRLMMQIAEKIAKKHGYSALVTGDSLGQVSSQTLSNIEAISRPIEMPILRPLLGFDKVEIISASRKIGTHDISRYHKDCGLGAISSASTKASEKELKQAEQQINFKELVKEALGTLEVVDFR